MFPTRFCCYTGSFSQKGWCACEENSSAAYLRSTLEARLEPVISLYRPMASCLRRRIPRTRRSWILNNYSNTREINTGQAEDHGGRDKSSLYSVVIGNCQDLMIDTDLAFSKFRLTLFLCPYFLQNVLSSPSIENVLWNCSHKRTARGTLDTAVFFILLHKIVRMKGGLYLSTEGGI